MSTLALPLHLVRPQAERKPVKYDRTQIDQLAAYVQSVGGGPQVPMGSLSDGDLAQGGDLFRTNCSSCHGTTFKGAPLSAGKIAPSLLDATDRQIYTAMLSGPSVLAPSKRISTQFAITASTRRPSPLASSSPPTPIWYQPLRVPSEH